MTSAADVSGDVSKLFGVGARDHKDMRLLCLCAFGVQ